MTGLASGVRALAAAALIAASLAACTTQTACASDVCVEGTLARAGADSLNPTWTVRADDGTVYELVGGLPRVFRQKAGARVKLVARDRPKSAGHGLGRPVAAVRVDAPGRATTGQPAR